MRIPKKFKLLGHTIDVIIEADLTNKTDCLGETRYRYCQIALQSISSKERHRSRTQLENTFLHEMTHWILHTMHENDLSNNEKFVGQFSGILHQILTTMEGEYKL